jgi:serine/threonine protein kinase
MRSIVRAWYVPLSLQSLHMLDIMLQLVEIADGLTYLHSQHIVHGNIHQAGPTRSRSQCSLLILGQHNIFVYDDGHAMLGSFSIAIFDSEVHSNADSMSTDDRRGMSGWMSPERMQGKHRITFQDDVFAFGCLLYSVRPLVSFSSSPFGNSMVDDQARCLWVGRHSQSLAALMQRSGSCADSAQSDRPAMNVLDPL